MNIFVRFDEIPTMTLEDINETKCKLWTDMRAIKNYKGK